MINKTIPDDIFTNFILKTSDFILVKDPKHTQDNFHYTIWSLQNIRNILDINSEIINDLKKFLLVVDKLNLFNINNSKKYFTFPPTINQLHLHIVPIDYVSYRPLEEIYNFNSIDLINENIIKVKQINKEKENAEYLSLPFRVGLIKLTKINELFKLENLKKDYNLNFIVMLREKFSDNLIEHLFNNYKLINIHIIVENNIFLYQNMIKFDIYLEI